MKKALFFWINKDKSAGAGPIWIDVPETEADRKELDARKASLMENPIALSELEDLKSLGLRWMHSASLNQFDGYSDSDRECADCTHHKIGGSE